MVRHASRQGRLAALYTGHLQFCWPPAESRYIWCFVLNNNNNNNRSSVVILKHYYFASYFCLLLFVWNSNPPPLPISPTPSLAERSTLASQLHLKQKISMDITVSETGAPSSVLGGSQGKLASVRTETRHYMTNYCNVTGKSQLGWGRWVPKPIRGCY